SGKPGGEIVPSPPAPSPGRHASVPGRGGAFYPASPPGPLSVTRRGGASPAETEPRRSVAADFYITVPTRRRFLSLPQHRDRDAVGLCKLDRLLVARIGMADEPPP